jgi:hypothetical protein
MNTPTTIELSDPGAAAPRAPDRAPTDPRSAVQQAWPNHREALRLREQAAALSAQPRCAENRSASARSLRSS